MNDQFHSSKHFRDLAAALDASKQMRELAAALDTTKQMRELAAAFDVSKQMRDMAAAFDVSKQMRDMAAAFDVSKQMREMAAAFDVSKQMRDAAAALDTTKQLRDLAAQLTRTQVLRWTHGVATAASGPIDDALTDLAASLADGTSSQDDGIPGWLFELPQLAQRRLFLLVLGALWAMTDAFNSFAGVTPPAHLDKLIIALLATVTVLNETIGDPPSNGS